MNVIDVPLDQIDIGERRREDMGDIAGLAQGIKRVGLLEPVIVDRNGKRGYRLIVGERRLRAVWMLGWKTIPAQLREELSEQELRDIELEENENRKSLTEQERTRRFASSKKLVEGFKKAEGVIGATPKTPNPKGGRPPKGEAPREEIAKALGVDERTIRRAEQHVRIAEQYPFMQGNEWRQSDVLRMGEELDLFSEDEQDQAMAVLECARILAPSNAVELLSNMAAMKAPARNEIYKLSKSEDPRDRSLALSKAAELPPMPDPRLNSITAALESLGRASKPFPKDPLTPRIEAVIQELKAIRVLVKEVSYDARRNQTKGAAVQ